MFWMLITAICAGLAGAGIGLGLRKLSRGRLPKGVMPVCAGIAMIASTVGIEYAWFPNNFDDLPEDSVILSKREQQAIYQPWTYVQPWVKGFVAFAPSETVETAPDSQVYAIQAHIRERWQPAMIRPAVIDCVRSERFDVSSTTRFGEDGRPLIAQPVSTGATDPVIEVVCANMGQ